MRLSHHSIILAAFLLLATNGKAQTDQYAQRLGNASFEDDDLSTLTTVNNSADGLRGYQTDQPAQWTVSGTKVTSLLVTKDCFTDNNFGLVTSLADGDKAFYLRMGWATGQTTLSQTLANLPKGRYRFSLDVRSAYANTATSSFTVFANDEAVTTAFDQGTTGFFQTAPWQTRSVTFENKTDGDVTVGLRADWLSGGSCVMMDHATLTLLPDSSGEADEPTEKDVSSPTEGAISADFEGEAAMKDSLLQMLARFSTYLVNDYKDAQAPNSAGEPCGCFQSNSSMKSNEDGVRSNADLSMVTAFLSRYGRGKVTLPEGVTWDQLDQMALRSLVFAYSTHKANRLKVCAGGDYWGSTSNGDHTWESSLWAMSVAYSAFFQWDRLTDAQKGYVEKLLKAECNYELQRSIPTGYAGDTKAEENGWEADVLAATIGLFPNDSLAPQWFERLRSFAINAYSHASDARDKTVIDPDYDSKTVADLYKGQNLYDDYTLQNHNYFHTSYQNVVIQELGEAALAMSLFQKTLYGTERWKTNALMHNNLKVQKEVLNWLALADGELAMPNGNDWSLFLYDQITSYTTNATFLRDPDALMLENLAYKMIQARQKTTQDGSWLLRSDIGARRMGVETHRVMMTWLMHDLNSTADLTPSTFADFRDRYDSARVFTSQNIVRGYSPDRFAIFSWAPGISSYTGYFTANSTDKNKIVVPFKANNTGNLIGWDTGDGKKTNATPVLSGTYRLEGSAWTMNGELSTNDAMLDNRFALYATPGNAFIYLDDVRALANAKITREQGGLLAISVDELTRQKRTLYYGDTHKQTDGSTLTEMTTPWVNIDNALGIVADNAGKKMAFGDKANNNSIMTAKLYPLYSSAQREVSSGQEVDRRHVIYYSGITAEATRSMAEAVVNLKDSLPAGWNGVIAADPDSVRYLLVANFASGQKATLKPVRTSLGYPVYREKSENGKTVFALEQNNSASEPLRFFVSEPLLTTRLAKDTDKVAYLHTDGSPVTLTVKAVTDEGVVTRDITVAGTVRLTIEGGNLTVEEATFPEDTTDTTYEGYTDITAQTLANPSFEEDATYGDTGEKVTASGITYDTCYVNSVAAADSKWPNVLPVTGWTPASTLKGGSNYCRMYSMPYSSTLFCVSPSNVGNYAAKTDAMVADDSCGVRTLTVLNSWDTGGNRITQTATLPAGDYHLLLDMRYDCPNQTSNDGKTVRTSSNACQSLTGVVIGGEADYRYPTVQGVWQVLDYAFSLATETSVTFSLGYATTASVGAANNTLLYVDHLRLLQRIATAISDHPAVSEKSGVVYNLAGQRVQTPCQGIYIKDGKKVIIR